MVINVLVTGAGGFIGSHTVLELLNATDNEYNVIALDNFHNSVQGSLLTFIILIFTIVSLFQMPNVSDR